MADIIHHRAHVVAGGFPAGSSAGHDHDYARLRLLTLLADRQIPASVANDFADVEKWLPVSRLLVTYVAGPYLPAGMRLLHIRRSGRDEPRAGRRQHRGRCRPRAPALRRPW